MRSKRKFHTETFPAASFGRAGLSVITCFRMYVCHLHAYICTVYIADNGYNFLRSDFFLSGGTTMSSGSIFDKSGFVDDYVYASLIELPCVHGKKCKL